jgi:prepilin-type N-terminal cleavage/methylation domain-containing protein
MLPCGTDNFYKSTPLPRGVQLPKTTMSRSFKRTAAAGFTLIELLIVVIILAIISAIAIPQFSAATADAQLAALDTSLANVRNSIEQYRVQHAGNLYPGATASTGGTACTGTQGTGAAGTVAAMTDQLRFASNAAGQTCSIAGGTFRFGPYLRQGIPAEPINNNDTVVVTQTGAAIAAATGAAAVGWAYDTRSGQFIMNSSVADPNGRIYAAH